ncbi:5'/3'-nucleotidase SurE [Pseudoclavibacter sp. CFCC 11306]|uniref:5'/3'-nucleotidase SurE n=1 Tax=Pseudoclavibacter sp. CFCC 11306 TaxID=1564493 RepID=UPI001300D11B|nr:5'/3'-nucleotidase SurE [Pseudoclavibacter sp. CFCC 11306]KAB1658540.1 5'/3'-nucleotidase SurE [Pseudoclavibacter sp. CFCC 11306]
MRALITNDDGIDSPGLVALARTARAAGYDVVVAAPPEEASGSSASINASESSAVTAAGGHGSIRVEPRELADLDAEAFTVFAAPALIALLAAHEAFGPPPDLVLSGINRGANIGRAILHSGTVGAALTGGVNGARGLAVSLAVADSREHPHWATAADAVRAALPRVANSAPGTVLNLNVPNAAPGRLESLEAVSATLAPFGIVHTTMTERQGDHVHLMIADPDDLPIAGSDAALLAAGRVTVTSITGITEAPV